MAKSLIRISILIALSLVAFFCILSEPASKNDFIWFVQFFVSKAIGVAAGYGLYKLYPRWVKTDKWVAAYGKWSSEGIEDEL